MSSAGVDDPDCCTRRWGCGRGVAWVARKWVYWYGRLLKRSEMDSMMKLGCAAWSLTPTYDSSFDGVIETIARLGFQGFELIAASRQVMDEYYTTTRCD